MGNVALDRRKRPDVAGAARERGELGERLCGATDPNHDVVGEPRRPVLGDLDPATVNRGHRSSAFERDRDQLTRRRRHQSHAVRSRALGRKFALGLTLDPEPRDQPGSSLTDVCRARTISCACRAHAGAVARSARQLVQRTYAIDPTAHEPGLGDPVGIAIEHGRAADERCELRCVAFDRLDAGLPRFERTVG